MSDIQPPSGYDQEEAHFTKREREALAQLRKAGDARRAETAARDAKAAHWMKCPKCGGQLVEARLENVVIDRCASCGGVYFDAGELELLVAHEKASSGFLGRLLRGK